MTAPSTMAPSAAAPDLSRTGLRSAADWYLISHACGCGDCPPVVAAGDRWVVQEVPGAGWVLHLPGQREIFAVLITTSGTVGHLRPRTETVAAGFARLAPVALAA